MGSAAVFRRISLLATLADSPTEFRADRGSLTDLALAPRGAGVSFSRVPCGPTALLEFGHLMGPRARGTDGILSAAALRGRIY